MRSKKKTVLFMRWVDFDNTNAQSLNAREIALRLDPSRFQCTLFYEREPDPRLLGRDNIRLVKVAPRLRTWILMRELLRGQQVISYVNYSPASYIYLHLPRLFRRGSVTFYHAEAPAAQGADVRGTAAFLMRSVLARCDLHSAISEFVRQDLAEQGIRAEFVLPVGVDTHFFTPPLERTDPIPTVLFAGTLIERKGAHLVIEAAQLLPEARFRLAGSGRGGFELELEKKCRDKGIRNVEFLGSQSQAAMRAIMQGSDVFLLPSRLEGIPKVTLEAAASGMPCVVFNDYQTPSVIDGKTGFQVKTFEEMLDRLRLLIQDAVLRRRMGEAAVQHARTFDWDEVASLWQRSFEQATGETRP